MTSLASAKVGDLIARPERHSNYRFVFGADAPWRIHQITAVTAANVWVGNAQIRKKDGLVIGTGGGHGRIEYAQLATPEMIKQTEDATSLYLRASAALQRLRDASEVIGRWKIYASGTPATKEHQPGLRKDLPAVDGITLDQAERLLAALDDIMKPPEPAQIDATRTEPTQEESDFLSTTFSHWDFSLPGHELTQSGEPAHINPGDAASCGIALALVAKGLLEVNGPVDQNSRGIRIKLTASGVQWMAEAPAEMNEDQEPSRSDRPAG